jgi:acyl-CoA reductase-like NAD-dependent aldehyde dehydrogenase
MSDVSPEGKIMSDFTVASPLTLTIGGEAAAGRGWIDVVNPATGAVFAQMPDAGAEQVDAAFDAANQAFGDWRGDDAFRRKTLNAMADALAASADEIGRILTAEQGKPLPQAQRELRIGEAYFRYYAELEPPREVVRDDDEVRVEVFRRPLGVVAAIAPFNFPLTLGIGKVAMALAGGNTVVLKPSPYTPLSTLRVGEVMRGVAPDGVFNVVSGNDELGALMTTHPLARGVSFTGSTATGKRIAAAAVGDLKRLVLELGGNDPVIVLDDADVDFTADRLFAAAFTNSGQVCVAPKRIYVPKALRSALVDALADRARAAKVGDGFLADTDLGPLNNAPQRDRVAGLVTDAVAHGATVAAGGKRIEGPGYFYQPTILSDVSDGVRIVDEEQFGPALPVVEYIDVDDAVRRANSGEFGLGSSVWSADPARANAVADRIDAGMSWINTHLVLSPAFPFGGAKWSGIGVEGGLRGLEAFTELQVRYEDKRAPVLSLD